MPSSTTSQSSDSSARLPSSGKRRSRLSPELREALKSKRHDLGLSLRRASQLLGIHISTLSYWENGRIQWVSSGKYVILKDFIAGNYDVYAEEIRALAQGNHNSLYEVLCRDDGLARILRSICNTYVLLEDDHRASKMFLDQIQDIISLTLTRLSIKRLSEESERDRSSESL